MRVFKRPWCVDETPYPKKRMRLPVILSRDELARLIESAPSPFHRTILITRYATGGRRAELAHLKIPDIDSERMAPHIPDGKGRRVRADHRQQHEFRRDRGLRGSKDRVHAPLKHNGEDAFPHEARVSGFQLTTKPIPFGTG